jgi:hypothetical protein
MMRTATPELVFESSRQQQEQIQKRKQRQQKTGKTVSRATLRAERKILSRNLTDLVKRNRAIGLVDIYGAVENKNGYTGRSVTENYQILCKMFVDPIVQDHPSKNPLLCGILEDSVSSVESILFGCGCLEESPRLSSVFRQQCLEAVVGGKYGNKTLFQIACIVQTCSYDCLRYFAPTEKVPLATLPPCTLLDMVNGPLLEFIVFHVMDGKSFLLRNAKALVGIGICMQNYDLFETVFFRLTPEDICGSDPDMDRVQQQLAQLYELQDQEESSYDSMDTIEEEEHERRVCLVDWLEKIQQPMDVERLACLVFKLVFECRHDFDMESILSTSWMFVDMVLDMAEKSVPFGTKDGKINFDRASDVLVVFMIRKYPLLLKLAAFDIKTHPCRTARRFTRILEFITVDEFLDLADNVLADHPLCFAYDPARPCDECGTRCFCMWQKACVSMCKISDKKDSVGEEFENIGLVLQRFPHMTNTVLSHPEFTSPRMQQRAVLAIALVEEYLVRDSLLFLEDEFVMQEDNRYQIFAADDYSSNDDDDDGKAASFSVVASADDETFEPETHALLSPPLPLPLLPVLPPRLISIVFERMIELLP